MDWGYTIIAVLFIAGVVLAFPLAIGIIVTIAILSVALDRFTDWCPGFRHLRRLHRRRIYCPGKVVTRFIAPDVRREVLVVEASTIDDGVISARIRTWNVLYAIRGLAPAAPFGEVQLVKLSELWDWSGARWGGPVPEPAAAESATVDGGS